MSGRLLNGRSSRDLYSSARRCIFRVDIWMVEPKVPSRLIIPRTACSDSRIIFRNVRQSRRIKNVMWRHARKRDFWWS